MSRQAYLGSRGREAEKKGKALLHTYRLPLPSMGRSGDAERDRTGRSLASFFLLSMERRREGREHGSRRGRKKRRKKKNKAPPCL